MDIFFPNKPDSEALDVCQDGQDTNVPILLYNILDMISPERGGQRYFRAIL